MNDIDKIAEMLTDDPDILNETGRPVDPRAAGYRKPGMSRLQHRSGQVSDLGGRPTPGSAEETGSEESNKPATEVQCKKCGATDWLNPGQHSKECSKCGDLISSHKMGTPKESKERQTDLKRIDELRSHLSNIKAKPETPERNAAILAIKQELTTLGRRLQDKEYSQL